MTQDDIIRLIESNELTLHGDIEHFAELVIKPWADQLEAERKKFKELNDVAALGMQHARADEREACAKVCDDWPNGRDDVCEIAAAIRARGNT